MSNPLYPIILTVFVAVQIIFVTFVGKVGSVIAISYDKWFISIAIGFISLPLGLLPYFQTFLGFKMLLSFLYFLRKFSVFYSNFLNSILM